VTARTLADLIEELSSLTPRDLPRRDELPAHLAEYLWWEPVHAAIRESKSKSERRRRLTDIIAEGNASRAAEEAHHLAAQREKEEIDDLNTRWKRGISRSMAKRREGKGAPGPLKRFVADTIKDRKLFRMSSDDAWGAFLTACADHHRVMEVYEGHIEAGGTTNAVQEVIVDDGKARFILGSGKSIKSPSGSDFLTLAHVRRVFNAELETYKSKAGEKS
jgi:hypothetical protein